MAKITNEQERHRYALARAAKDPRFDGAFFVAVKSTGIFCRPICPAPFPKEDNVDYYRRASQALDAGFRPCLRCRPDSAPGSPAWSGTSASVTRALRLLEEHTEQPISQIAERVGVSARYLHKLIIDNIGLSPQKYRRYSQALFAKQLLQQTNLSMSEVALACGLSSARRLQSLCQQVLAKTPTELRVRKTSANHRDIRVFLSYRPPYDWPSVQAFLARRQVECVETISQNRFSKAFIIDGESGRFVATHCPQKHGFDVSIQVSNLAILRTVIANITRVLDLRADPLITETALLNAGLSADWLNTGLRLPGVWSEFEAGIRAILGQQVSVTAAINLLNKVVDTYACHTPFGPVFPTPKTLASASLDCISMPGARKAALNAFSQLYSENASPSDKQILSVKGVGPWTLDYIKLRGRSEPDVFLGGDLIVKKMLAKTRINASKSQPWRSYLTLQLWALSDKLKE